MTENCKKLPALILALGLSLTVCATAWAGIAANTRIINQAALSYLDSAGKPTTLTATAIVKIALQPAPPAILQGPNQADFYTGPNTTLKNTFTVRATANGPDSYTLSTNISGSANTTNPTATITVPAMNPINLGSTLTLVSVDSTSLTVYGDGVADNTINGIQTGDTVAIEINGTYEARTVVSVTDNAVGTSLITLDSGLSATPGAGVLVAEQVEVTVDVTAGDIDTPGTDVTVDKILTAVSTTDNSAKAESSAILDTFSSRLAALDKYVRNASHPNGSGNYIDFNGSRYFLGGVTGGPGETLEYLLVASNGGATSVTDASVVDILPADYVAFKANAYGPGREITYISESNTATTLSAAADADAATYESATRTLTVYVGNGATGAAGGTVAGGKQVSVLYQLTVNQ